MNPSQKSSEEKKPEKTFYDFNALDFNSTENLARQEATKQQSKHPVFVGNVKKPGQNLFASPPKPSSPPKQRRTLQTPFGKVQLEGCSNVTFGTRVIRNPSPSPRATSTATSTSTGAIPKSASVHVGPGQLKKLQKKGGSLVISGQSGVHIGKSYEFNSPVSKNTEKQKTATVTPQLQQQTQKTLSESNVGQRKSDTNPPLQPGLTLSNREMQKPENRNRSLVNIRELNKEGERLHGQFMKDKTASNFTTLSSPSSQQAVSSFSSSSSLFAPKCSNKTQKSTEKSTTKPSAEARHAMSS